MEASRSPIEGQNSPKQCKQNCLLISRFGGSKSGKDSAHRRGAESLHVPPPREHPAAPGVQTLDKKILSCLLQFTK